MTDSKKRFSNRVEYYVRSRPKYPAALLQFLQTELGLTPQHAIADVGSGTGFLTEPFVRNGNVIFAVEPNAEMRAAAETYLGDLPGFRSIDATAEATTLATASVDFVVAGQAFHWFNPVAARNEFIRILRPGGHVLLVWNQRRQDDPFARKYQELIDRFQIDHEAVKARSIAATESAILQQFFGQAGYVRRTFDNPQWLDRQGLLDRIASSSYMPLAPHPSFFAMEKGANELFDAHQQNGKVLIPHDTEVFLGSLG